MHPRRITTARTVSLRSTRANGEEQRLSDGFSFKEPNERGEKTRWSGVVEAVGSGLSGRQERAEAEVSAGTGKDDGRGMAERADGSDGSHTSTASVMILRHSRVPEQTPNGRWCGMYSVTTLREARKEGEDGRDDDEPSVIHVPIQSGLRSVTFQRITTGGGLSRYANANLPRPRITGKDCNESSGGVRILGRMG
jgi:hypothetical protein